MWCTVELVPKLAAYPIYRPPHAVDTTQRPVFPGRVPRREAQVLAPISTTLRHNVLILMLNDDSRNLAKRRVALAPANGRIFDRHATWIGLPLNEEIEHEPRVIGSQ